MDLEQLMGTDDFKALTLSEQIYLVIHKTPIDFGGRVVWIGTPKSLEMKEMIMKLIEAKK